MKSLYVKRCSNSTAVTQEVEGDILRDMLSDLTLDFSPTSPVPTEQGQADPRWLAILTRKAKGAAAYRETARRHSAPGRLPSRTPAAANDDTPAEPVATPDRVTKLVNRRSRRKRRKSVLRQSADARKMRAPMEAAKGEAVVGSLHLPSHPFTKQASNSNTSPTNGRDRALASWEHAGELPQLIAVNRALDRFGVPFAWSLNLDPDLIQAANENARGFLDFIRRRVVRILKRELGRAVPLWIMLETDRHGRPHLHGGTAMNENEAPAVFERALAEAGGNWTRQGSRCADVRRQWHADGWAAYPAKAMAQTCGDLRRAAGLDPAAPVALWSCSNDLRAAGKEIHAELRRLYNVTKSQPEEAMADKFLDALDALKDAFTNGDELDAALEEIAAEHGVTPVALRNRATLAWGDLTAFSAKCAEGAAHAAKVKAAGERYTRYVYLRAKVEKGQKLTEDEIKFMDDRFLNNIEAAEDRKLVNQN